MENNFSTPQRMLHGVGTGVENSGSIYRSGGTVDGKVEKSPFQRVPLGAVPENRSALLSGVQRILVKPKTQDTTPSQSLRSPNNFMKPTESSRVNSSTPVRVHSSRNTPSTNTPSYAQPIHSSAVDSANIHHFVSPHAQNAPVATPTRPQSAGRALSAPRTSPGHLAAGSPKRATPNQQETSQSVGHSARKLTPSVVVGSAKKAREGRETRVSESVTPKSAGGTPNATGSAYQYDMTTTASQMLFSPDAAQRQAARQHRASPARLIASPSSGSKTTASTTTNAARPASAPRLRPQSLSAQLAAHSEHLQRLTPDHHGSTLSNAGNAGSVLSPNVEGQALSHRSPAGNKATDAANSAVPTASGGAPTVTSPSNANPSSGGKVKPPTHTHLPQPSTAHTHSHIPKAAPVRSADVLSANKAAKKAALALQTQPHAAHSAVHSGAAHANAPSAGGTNGVARYLQPTHSSAAATTALLTNPTASHPKVQKSRIPAYARPTANSAGIAAQNDEVPTPSRVSKLAKRPPSAPSAATTVGSKSNVSIGLRRKESLEKLPAHSPTSNNTGAKANKTLKTSPNDSKKPKSSSGRKEGAQNTSHNGTLNVSAIMHMLEGTSTNERALMANEQTGKDNSKMQKIRRSYSFGSELSCVVGEEEGMSLGGSIDFSGNDTFESDPLSLSQRVPTPSPVHTLNAMHTEACNGAGGEGENASTSGSEDVPDVTLGHNCTVDNGTDLSVKKAVVTRMRNNHSATSGLSSGSPVAARATTRSPLRLQVLEDGLANLSMVEAPATFSPINISMLSNFSHNDFITASETVDFTTTTTTADAHEATTTHYHATTTYAVEKDSTGFVPISNINTATSSSGMHTNATSLSQRLARATSTSHVGSCATDKMTTHTVSPTHHTPAELSYIHHVNSMNNLSYSASQSASNINYSATNTTTSATKKKKAEPWTEDYSALFPPDSALDSDGNMHRHAGLDDSYNSSNSQVNIVNALNYTGIDVSRSDINASNTSVGPMDYAESPRPRDLNRPQHHSVGNNNIDSVQRVRTVGASTFDPVASASNPLNTAMLQSTVTLNTTHSTVRTFDHDILNQAMLNTNNASLSNSTYSLGPAVLTTGHPQLVRNISDNMSTQSFNISAIAPVANMTSSSFDMENIENIESMDQFNSENFLFSRSSSRMQNLSRGAVGVSADSNITNNTYNTHNTYNTANTSGNILDRAMIASYDVDELASDLRLCRTFGSGVSDSTMSVSPFLLSHPGFERSASDNYTNVGSTISNVITPVATSVSGIGLRTTFFPPPAPVRATEHIVHTSDVTTSADRNYPVSDSVRGSQEFNESMDKIFGGADSQQYDPQDTNFAGPDSHSNPLNNFSINHSGDHSILHSVLNSVEWNMQQSVESLPPPPPPMEAYPTHPLHNNNTIGVSGNLVSDTSRTSGVIALNSSSTNHTGRFDSENDSVLHDTCEFERIESSHSSPPNSDANGDSSGDNMGNNYTVTSIPGSDRLQSDAAGNTSGHSEHHVDTTNNTDSSHSASIHPTVLDTSVDLTASNSNVHLRGFHLPMPVINTTQNVQSYLDFENDDQPHSNTLSARPVSPLPPVLSPDSTILKQQLLQESMRQFSAMHTFTGDNNFNYSAYEPIVPAGVDGVDHHNVRSSYGMSSLARLPSIGSMRSLSYIASSTEGSPRYQDIEAEDTVSGSQERVKNETVGEGYSDSEEELDEINEDYDGYEYANTNNVMMGESGGVDLSMHSGVSHLTHSVNESVSDSLSSNGHSNAYLGNGVNDSVTLSVAHSVGGNSVNSGCYTSSVEELKTCNPKVRTGSWVKEQYPKDSGTLVSVTNSHITPRKQTVSRSTLYQAQSATEAPVHTPNNMYRAIASVRTPLQNAQGYRDASYFTNESMAPVPPQPSVIVREEVNIDEHIGMYYGEQNNPDPLARQLLLMDEQMHELEMKKGRFRGMQHVFAPVNTLVDSTEL